MPDDAKRDTQRESRSGVLIIDKPAGITSAGVVSRVKRALGARKVGHAGTLDPDATGLLVCLINQATKVASYAVEGEKVYSGSIRFGIRTTTEDMSGEVLSENTDFPPFSVVAEAARVFDGHIRQVPPKVSALKVDGKRAYALQRAGVAFELQGREVIVSSLDLAPLSEDVDRCQRVSYRLTCSPGTYVRALARDLGEAVGCGATVESIRRERSGPLSVEMGVSLEEIGWEHLHDWGILVPHLPRIEVDLSLLARLRQGRADALRDAEKIVQGDATIEAAGLCVYQVAGQSSNPRGILSVREGRAGYAVWVGDE